MSKTRRRGADDARASASRARAPLFGERETVSASLLGGKIRRMRQSRGWSQGELARQLDCALDQGGISRLERGLVAEPSAKSIYQLSRAFGVPTDELLAILVTGEDAQAVAVRDGELAELKQEVEVLMDRLVAYEQRMKAV